MSVPMIRISACATSEEASKVDRLPSAKVIEVLRAAEAFCFDVDSTVCTDEGIDELAEWCGAGEAVAEMTRKAMGGGMSFREALQARLDLMNPSQEAVNDFVRSNPPKLSPGVKELIHTLQSKGKTVFLVSGGFRQMIEPVADALNIPHSNIYANRLLFNESGDFVEFDKTEFTSESGGKANAIVHLKEKYGYEKIVMMGDGATDLEARKDGGADMFIGYGGVSVRNIVAENADWFLLEFNPLLEALNKHC